MNVLMIEPRHREEDQFALSLEHRAVMSVQALKGAVEEIQALSYEAKGRDLLIEELEHIMGAQLALALVESLVRARMEATID